MTDPYNVGTILTVYKCWLLTVQFNRLQTKSTPNLRLVHMNTFSHRFHQTASFSFLYYLVSTRKRSKTMITLYNMCSVHRGMFSTSGDVQYIGGSHEYIGRIPWVHRGNIMCTSGDVQYIKGISWCMWGSKLIKPCNLYWKLDVLNIPRYAHDIPPPMHSWYPPDVLNIPQCTHDIPHMYQDIPPMYWTHIIQGENDNFWKRSPKWKDLKTILL